MTPLTDNVDLHVFLGSEKSADNRFPVSVNATWQQIDFIPFADNAKRIRVELRPEPEAATFRPVRLPGVFLTIQRSKAPSPTDDEARVEGFFRLLGMHGVVSEEDAVQVFGSHRALRRFSLAFESHVAKRPYRVRIEVADGGKRYVREGER
jgi:hypothetical protein